MSNSDRERLNFKIMTKKQVKKYVVSSLITFGTAFAVALLPQIDSITIESIQTGAVFGIIFTAARAALKAVIEFLIAIKANQR